MSSLRALLDWKNLSPWRAFIIVAYIPRYRMPIDWILLILAGAAAWTLLKSKPETEVEYAQ